MINWNTLFAALIAAGVITAAPAAYADAHCTAAGESGGCEPDEDDPSPGPDTGNPGESGDYTPDEDPADPPAEPSAPPGESPSQQDDD